MDTHYLQRALELAHTAEQQGEVPVGAVIVMNGTIVGEGYNQSITHSDCTAHAEIQALRDAGQRMNNYRLLGATLYVTLEPCVMCVGALIQARIERLVFGAYDPKAGAVVSCSQLLEWPYFNHRIQSIGGLLSEPCGDILKNFFKKKRDTLDAEIPKRA